MIEQQTVDFQKFTVEVYGGFQPSFVYLGLAKTYYMSSPEREVKLETHEYQITFEGGQAYYEDQSGNPELYAVVVGRAQHLHYSIFGHLSMRIEQPVLPFGLEPNTPYKITLDLLNHTATIQRLTRPARGFMPLAQWLERNVKGQSVYAHKRNN